MTDKSFTTVTAKEAVGRLLGKAVDAARADDAMKFAQAAINAANTLYALEERPPKRA
jgi:hypothetical protein